MQCSTVQALLMSQLRTVVSNILALSTERAFASPMVEVAIPSRAPGDLQAALHSNAAELNIPSGSLPMRSFGLIKSRFGSPSSLLPKDAKRRVEATSLFMTSLTDHSSQGVGRSSWLWLIDARTEAARVWARSRIRKGSGKFATLNN